MNVVGGYSLFIEISDNYLIKSASENEISFYESSYQKKFPSKYIPLYKGKILRSSVHFKVIVSFVLQCKKLFKESIKEKGYTEEEINIEKDPKFNENFSHFINNRENDAIILSPSFIALKETLNSLISSKLKWILFWFVKWKENFLNYDYIIIENLTYKMKYPIILDIKLGSSPRISKENKSLKIFGGASNEIGCRIMGLQRYSEFKNRYDTRKLTIEEFTKEVSLFFVNDNAISLNIINQASIDVNNIINEVKQDKHFLMKYSSLLIIYDKYNLNNIITKLIDFSYLYIILYY